MTKIVYLRIIMVPLVIVLCSMLVLTGCYTYSPLARESGPDALPGEDTGIQVSTVDGRTITVAAYHFLRVDRPVSLIYGTGERRASQGGGFDDYRGTIDPLDGKTEMRFNSEGRYEAWEVFALRDGSTAQFLRSDLIKVDSAAGPGLWCTGLEKSARGNDTLFSGRIPFDQIRSIGVRTFSWPNTILAGIGIGAGVAFVGGMIWLASHPLRFGFNVSPR